MCVPWIENFSSFSCFSFSFFLSFFFFFGLFEHKQRRILQQGRNDHETFYRRETHRAQASHAEREEGSVATTESSLTIESLSSKRGIPIETCPQQGSPSTIGLQVDMNVQGDLRGGGAGATRAPFHILTTLCGCASGHAAARGWAHLS